jgi:uncharacterized protein
MNAILAVAARLTALRPGRVVAVLGLVTLVLAYFAGNQTTDTELTAFAPDSELAAAHERVQQEFGAGGAGLQVVVDAGEGGDVLSPDGLQAALAVEEAAVDSGAPLLGGQAGVSSFAGQVVLTLQGNGVDPDQATPAEIDQAAAEALSGSAAQLVSVEADVDAGTARAGLVVFTFDPALDEVAVAQASRELTAVIDGEVSVAGIDVDPFSVVVFTDSLTEASEEEMPRLLGLSLLLILGILLFQYRTVTDVVIGLVGLFAIILWMFGLGVLLGPDHLGVTGPFTQISLIIPVLLVGLGIDYAIHLTSRYREEQRHGQTPPRSATMAVRTVGGALVLATATTLVGFLTNLASPLPPIADFGIFTATGVLAAFVVMTLLVPATRNLLDGRRARKGKALAGVAHRPAGGLARVMARTAVVAEKAPVPTLVVAAVLSLGAAGAATQVETSFSQDDFIPDDTPIADLLDRMQTLFSGDVSETTYALVDGDLTDPAVANAALAAEANMADTDGVRAGGGVAQTTSAPVLLTEIAAADEGLATQIAELGFTPGQGFTDDADVAALYDLARSLTPGGMAQVLNDDASAGVIAVATTAGQDGARSLAAELEADVAPLLDAGADVVVTSENLVLEESLDALTDSQTQGIVITLVAAFLLLVTYFGFTERTPMLGAITMVPSMAVVSWVLGTMWVFGISFNVLTAMVASLGIGIGVPFGIHVTYRFLEDRRRYDTVDEAIRHTMTHTGGAMAGSAATTAAGFGVLAFASLTPIRQFGSILALTILFSLAAAVLVQPSCLKLWGEWRARRGDTGTLLDHERRDHHDPSAGADAGDAEEDEQDEEDDRAPVAG